MNRILLISFSALLALLVSCQKPVDEDIEPLPPEPEPPVQTGDSTLLWKYVELDPNFASGGDTLSVTYFKYDAAQRMTEQFITEFNLAGNQLDYSQLFEYRYKGSETLPYLAIRHNRALADPDFQADDSIFLRYENGLVSFDSTMLYHLGSATAYGMVRHSFTTTGENSTLHSQSRWPMYGPAEYESDETFPIKMDRQDGNLLGFESPDGPEHPYNIRKFNDHPDPMYRTYIPFAVDYQLWEWGRPAYKNLIIYQGGGNNLYGQAPNGWWYYDEITYTYRADGYPLTAKVLNNDNDNYNIAYVYY